MKTTTALLTLVSLLSASSAFAAADLTAAVSSSTGDYVYDTVSYSVLVRNVGNKNADSSSVVIELPKTNTSPGVYVMGDMMGKDNRCSQSGTRLTCSLGTIRKGKNTSVWFDIRLPQSAAPLVVTATAASPSEANTSNNSSSHTASLLNDPVAISDGDLILNEHCTGQGLVSFYECTLFPSSISSHEAIYSAGGGIAFVNLPPSYSGVWSQPASNELVFTYFDGTTPVAEFHGYGVDGDCFEGLTTFPGSAWVSPYSVCIQ